MRSMSRLLRSRRAASAVLAAGAVLMLIGVIRAGQLDSAVRYGVSEIGHVTAVSDSRVTLVYERHGEDHIVSAYPKSPSDFTAGDVAQIRVVLDGGSVATIDGTENSTGWYLIWVGAGGIVAGAGLVWLLSWTSAPVDTVSPVKYAGHRHGGA